MKQTKCNERISYFCVINSNNNLVYGQIFQSCHFEGFFNTICVNILFYTINFLWSIKHVIASFQIESDILQRNFHFFFSDTGRLYGEIQTFAHPVHFQYNRSEHEFILGTVPKVPQVQFHCHLNCGSDSDWIILNKRLHIRGSMKYRPPFVQCSYNGQALKHNSSQLLYSIPLELKFL